MDYSGDQENSADAGTVAERASQVRATVGWADSARDALQKVAFGQRVESVASFGADGWQVTQVSRFRA